jgi:hypothetical protein
VNNNIKNENEINVSFFSDHYKFLKDVKLKAVIEHIKSGYWREFISKIRKEKSIGNVEWVTLKNKLVGFTPCATFSKQRLKPYLTHYNKLIVLDIDKLDLVTIEAVKNKIISDKFTHACFISPSGFGIKIFVKVNSNQENHEIAYKQVANYFEKTFGQKIDRSGKDITRLCYISADEEAYFDELSAAFEITLVDSIINDDKIFVEDTGLKGFEESVNQFEKILRLTQNKIDFVEGRRNNFIYLLANNSNRWNIPQEHLIELIVKNGYCYERREVIATVNSAYRNTHQNNKFPAFRLESKEKRLARLQARKVASVIKRNNEVDVNKTPFIPNSVYESLPSLLKLGTQVFDDLRQKDIFLTGALGVLSGCFPALSGLYHKNVVYPNLYTFVTAPPASGKGALLHAKSYGLDYHKYIITSGADDNSKPKSLLFIPGNASAAAIFNHISQNGGMGIFFESEADSLSNTFNKEWGDFSDLLRKAYHHENVSYTRKGNNEYIEIEHPKLSVVLSGTPKQVQSLTKSVEDGLFSRILFYSFNSDLKWEDVSPKGKVDNLREHFERVGKDSFNIIQKFLNYESIKFNLTDEQWGILNEEQEKSLFNVTDDYSEDTAGMVKRMGLMWFRIAMILSALRSFENLNKEGLILCDDKDFIISQTLMKIYKAHILSVYSSLSKQEGIKVDRMLNQFYNNLPEEEFNRKCAIETAEKLNFRSRKADGFLNELVAEGKLIKRQLGVYKKVKNINNA